MGYTSLHAVKESTNYLCKAWVHKDDICMGFILLIIHQYLLLTHYFRIIQLNLRDRDNLRTKDRRPIPKVSFDYITVLFSMQEPVEDGSPSAETCFDTERSACPQAAAFLSRRTRITPPTYVYTPFVSDLVLAKSVAVGKTPR